MNNILTKLKPLKDDEYNQNQLLDKITINIYNKAVQIYEIAEKLNLEYEVFRDGLNGIDVTFYQKPFSISILINPNLSIEYIVEVKQSFKDGSTSWTELEGGNIEFEDIEQKIMEVFNLGEIAVPL